MFTAECAETAERYELFTLGGLCALGGELALTHLRIDCQGVQRLGFGEAAHEVHVLHRLARRPLY